MKLFDKQREKSRREMLASTAKAALGIQFGWTAANMFGSLMPESQFTAAIKRAMMLGDRAALAQMAEGNSFSKYLFHFVLIDKFTPYLFMNMGTQDVGANDLGDFDGAGATYMGADISGMATADAVSPFRNRGFTSLFGDYLNLPDDMNLAWINSFTSGTGGHSLNNARLSNDLGSLNYQFEQAQIAAGQASLLGPVGFDIRSDAQSSGDLFQAPGGRVMQGHESVRALRQNMEQSARPLAEIKNNRDLRRELDRLAARDTGLTDSIIAVSDRMNAMMPDLRIAEVGMNGAGEQEDVVFRQIEAAITLAQNGAANNFVIGVPWRDTNGNSVLQRGNGRGRPEGGKNPYEMTPSIARALSRIAEVFGEKVVAAFSHDGTRNRGLGDGDEGSTMIMAHNSLIQDVSVGTLPTLAELGRDANPIALSNGTMAVANHSNYQATVLRALGVEVDVPHIDGILVPQT